MRVKRPILVTFIGDLLLINAILLFFSSFPTPKFIEEFGVYFFPLNNAYDYILRILNIIIFLAIAYGFFKLKKWGYYLMISYNLFLLVISILSLIEFIKIPGNFQGSQFISSLIWLILTYPSKRYFIGENLELD
ncbi:hypothetical protein NNC19_17165 [Clostridium sp. SHJSY1]|uniref:hypothetical protein n=1 Tax=Clostridium sp. SHJSY1 TaxID=2942483 RepID=UPI0028768B5A|nr:hypothetical protein [Clostridium sp. SHJSY1]MDS0527422.1 hypothetical protein [Clostridium sp. SHJSY1]